MDDLAFDSGTTSYAVDLVRGFKSGLVAVRQRFDLPIAVWPTGGPGSVPRPRNPKAQGPKAVWIHPVLSSRELCTEPYIGAEACLINYRK